MKSQYTLCTILVLVCLRLAIGWHFYKEGAKKMQNPEFSSAGFLSQARGPLAGTFKRYIPDRFGEKRLDKEGTLQRWSQYKEHLARRNNFTEAQQEQANVVLQNYKGQLEWFHDSNAVDLEEYRNELSRLQAAEKKPGARDVPFMSARTADLENKQLAKARAWLATVDEMQHALERDLNAVITGIPRADASWLNFETAAAHWERYPGDLADHYKLDAEQLAEAEAIRKRHQGRLNRYYAGVQHAYDKYQQDFAHLESAQKELAENQEKFEKSKAGMTDEALTQRQKELKARAVQLEKREDELQTRLGEWTAILDDRSADVTRKIRALLDDRQLGRDFPAPDLSHSRIDTLITWLTFLVGVCLMLGLLTRVASVAGALFLFSVMLTQWPLAVGAQPIYYQLVECLALLVLAATAAGRFAGLDYFFYAWRNGCCASTPASKPTTTKPVTQ